ncbi:MAG TPA: DUF4270 family protein [Bacteroidales bacterium]|nr:DUF4270 family protein [Bacteroidales bacterium]
MTRFYHNSGNSRIKQRVSFFSIFLLSILFISLFMVSCEEDATLIGNELLPGKDFVSIIATDTIRPLSFTMYDDTTSTGTPTSAYLGQSWDPYFGTTSASFASQIRLKDEWGGGDFVIDSMKLVLEFTNVRGGSSGTHSLFFQEIATDLTTTGSYNSKTPLAFADFSMELPLPALKEDTINSVEIKFTDLGFAQRLFSDTSKLFHSNKVPDFRSFFKGLYFKLNSTGDPMMVSLNLANSNVISSSPVYSNFFVVYLHNSAGSSGAYYFILDAYNRNASFSIFTHDFSTAEEGKRITHYNDLSVRDSMTYLQTLNGLYTKMTFPGLEKLKQSGNLGKIAVNKARLTLPYFFDEGEYKTSDIPSQIYIRYRGSDGKRYNLPDLAVGYEADYDYSTFLDGLRDSTENAYHFNIPGFVQEYLNDNSNTILPELEIYLKRGINNGILKANNSKKPVKFEFAYTKF